MSTEIRPFRGWHFTGDVSNLIAPPYDVLSAAEKQALLDRSGDNIVSVDLPHVPPKDVGPDSAYAAAAEKLADLQRRGVLVQDATPCLYPYAQTYTWGGQSYTRRVMLCAVRATALCDGVWPHEKTFAGPKADRLKLTEATRTQLSPIFGFFDDTLGAGDALWSALPEEPIACGELNGVREQLWAVRDPEVLAVVRGALAGRPIFIADGHHRYTTALNYRDRLAEQGRLDSNHPANFVMFALASMSDPGLLVLPTHRLIAGLGDDIGAPAIVSATRGVFQWQQVPLDRAALADADALLRPFGAGAIAMLDGRLDVMHVGRLIAPDAMRQAAPDEIDAWRGLDVAVVHRLLLERFIAPLAGGGELDLAYTARGHEVVDALENGSAQLAVVMQGTPLAAVKEIALAHATMPHKSTYFYPKLTTGMVLKPLA